ncbi:dihydroorotase [Legionella sp. CNM-4043-24]|uniref:dihydroorotase n=1 Tax=Legionella sp. CNM-4043-24 TaxID=3421646 RepID=UPI00403B2061
MQTLTISRPDDWHVHLRDGQVLPHTVSASARHFARALVMPNLKPPLTTLASLLDYRGRILAALPPGSGFRPMMTFYLNSSLSADDIEASRNHPDIMGAKLYPAGATTNSDEGVSSLRAIYPLIEVMQDCDLVLQIHGEVTEGDIFDREAVFITDYLEKLVKDFPRLRIVLEHISTQAAVDFVKDSPETVAATITPHHMLYNRNRLLAGGIRPHYYCLPVLKHERDRQAIVQAAISGHPKFFAGTDSAPHARSTKENACGCAGIYSAPYALAFYAQVFEQEGQLPHLNAFLSRHGADFYRVPVNEEQLVLIKQEQHVPPVLAFGADEIVPMAAGETLPWSVYESI